MKLLPKIFGCFIGLSMCNFVCAMQTPISLLRSPSVIQRSPNAAQQIDLLRQKFIAAAGDAKQKELVKQLAEQDEVADKKTLDAALLNAACQFKKSRVKHKKGKIVPLTPHEQKYLDMVSTLITVAMQKKIAFDNGFTKKSNHLKVHYNKLMMNYDPRIKISPKKVVQPVKCSDKKSTEEKKQFNFKNLTVDVNAPVDDSVYRVAVRRIFW